MAVLIEGISVVVRKQSLAGKYPHGVDGFRRAAPNATLCEDEFLMSVAFMSPIDVRDYIANLEARGLVFLAANKAVDLAVFDQQLGPTAECDWAHAARREISPGKTVMACEAFEAGTTGSSVALPASWRYERSLTLHYTYVEADKVNATLTPLDARDGVQVYRDKASGKAVCLGSPFELERKAEHAAIERIARRAMELGAITASASGASSVDLNETALAELRERLLPEAQRLVSRARFTPGFAHFALGLVLRAMKDRTQAIEQFMLSLDYCPDVPNTLLELVRCLGEAGRASEALPFASRAAEVSPQSAACLGNLAAVLHELNRGDEAWKAIKKAVAIDPDDPINLKILEACRAKFGPEP